MNSFMSTTASALPTSGPPAARHSDSSALTRGSSGAMLPGSVPNSDAIMSKLRLSGRRVPFSHLATRLRETDRLSASASCDMPLASRCCLMIKPVKFFIVFLCIAAFLLIFCNGRISRTILEISSVEAKERSSEAINEALYNSIINIETDAEDFFIYTPEGTYSANMFLINSLSATISSYISEYMKEKSKIQIEIPFGMLTGIDMLSNMGPDLKIYIKPSGAVNINTKSEVVSAGINQVNYKIYFDVEMESKIVMPLKEQSVKFRKEILIVDAVIRGDIPEAYLNVDQK